MEVCPESLGAMSEYWYIERGLFLLPYDICSSYMETARRDWKVITGSIILSTLWKETEITDSLQLSCVNQECDEK